MNKAKKITTSEKLFEFLEAMSKNNNKLIGQNSNLKFSDNTNMNQFWNNNRETIIDLIKINKEYSKRYNDSCEVLINLYSKYKKRKIKVKTISFEDKLLEFLEAMHKNNDSIILIDFTEDTKPQDLGNRVYLCNEHKEKLIDLLLPF